jgi:hypothetical protein
MADNNSLDAESLEKTNRLLKENVGELNDFAKSLKDADDVTQKNIKAMKDLAKWTKDLGATMLSNEEGSGKYGKSITAVTDKAGEMASSFGILGSVVGFVIKQLGGLAAASLKQNDALIKSYRTLSDFGAIDSSGLEGVMKMGHAMGGTAENMEYVNSTLKQMAPELSTFGGSVAQGAKQFAALTNGLLQPQLELKFKQLGYSTQDMVKYSGQYVAMQAKSGLTQGKSTEEMTVRTASYLSTLSELTMLTGQSRDEAAAVMEAQQRELGFRLKLAEIEKKNPEEAERLRKSVAAVTMANKDMGAMVMEQIVNDGAVVTQKSAQLAGQMPNLYQDIVNVGKGTGDVAADSMKAVQKQLPEIDRMVAQFGSTGKISAEAAGALGLNVDLLNTKAKMQGMNVDQVRAELEKMTKSGDGRIKADTQRERSERQAKQGVDLLTYTMGEVAVPIVNSLATAMNKLGATIADVIYGITKTGLFGMETIDIRGAFKEFTDMADVAKTLAEEQEKQKVLGEEIRKNDAKLLDMNKEEESLKAKAMVANLSLDANDIAQGITTKEQQDLDKFQKQKAELVARNKSAKSEMATSKASSQQASMAGAGMAGAPVTVGEADLAGLTMKKGDVQKEGAKLSPNLIALARKIQSGIGDFGYFSSFNDNYHQDKKSNHNKGTALDFVLNKDIKGDKEAGAKVIEALRAMGATNIIDEYNNPSANATGGHIHAEVSAKTQGMFKGPESGYWLKAHGEEALMNQQGLSNLITKAQMPGAGGASDDIIGAMQDTMVALTEKLEEVVSILQKSHNTQEELLTYSKV